MADIDRNRRPTWAGMRSLNKQGAFSWTKQDGMVQLPNLEGTHCFALAVNGKSQIVGMCMVTGDSSYFAYPVLWEKSQGQ